MSYTLTREQERDLILRAQKGEAKARSEIVALNQPLVGWVVRRYYGRLCERYYDDLVGEGNIGLITALDKFRATYGGFATYAIYWIRSSVSKFAARAMRLSPSNVDARLLANYDEVLRRVSSGEDPSDVAKDFGDKISGDRVMHFLTRRQAHVSIESSGVIGGGIEDMIADAGAITEQDIADAEDFRRRLDIVRDELARMPARDADVVWARYRGETTAQIGERMGISHQRVTSLCARAMGRLGKRARRRARAVAGA